MAWRYLLANAKHSLRFFLRQLANTAYLRITGIVIMYLMAPICAIQVKNYLDITVFSQSCKTVYGGARVVLNISCVDEKHGGHSAYSLLIKD